MSRRPASTLQQLLALSVDAPLVVGHRLTRMAANAHAPQAADQRELQRMGREKLQAALDGWWAMGWAMLEWQQRAWQSLWLPGGRLPVPSMGDMDRVIAAGLLPASRTVAANRRRLSGVKQAAEKRRR